ncbi:acylphosphatase [Ornithinibacillus sp. FSL M8-0202]|uniref:acylphosphatase n=1 Tax=unclassified Ornithinibacillus TaxID=2620869 RepID=UPI0030CB807C
MNVHIIVSGRVQGVGFRFAAKQKAIDYDLKGWVRNLEDGRVELEIEGTKAPITAYIKQLKEGFHPLIRIDDVQITVNETHQHYKAFDIK